jgi:hypothetical protein
MDDLKIWNILTSCQWQNLDSLQLSYQFQPSLESPYKVVINSPNEGAATSKKIDGTVQIDQQNITISSSKFGEKIYFFDEQLQHLRSLSNCSDRIVKVNDVAAYRKDSTPDVWNEIRLGLSSTDQVVIRENLFLITTIFGLKHRPILPAVLELTNSPQSEIRAFAVWAGAHQVVPLIEFMRRLKEMKNDPEIWVQNEIGRSVLHNSYLIRELEDDFNQDVRRLAKELLSSK